ncbi:MAG: MHYT domain-containing protein [Hyphomicrobium sp.]|nr:MHYT domain-containing protein [Hyphomicrobium sp.]
MTLTMSLAMTLTSLLSDFFTVNVDTADALPSRYNYVLVLISYLVASLASYTFLQFAGRIVELRHSVARFAWLAAGAVMMGVGTWAMHFVGMLAYILPIPVSYDVVPTALSVVPAILAAAIALHVVARPQVSTRRLLIGGTLRGAGIGLMHYGGMEAMSVNALVRYDPALFATSIVAAVVLSILALQVRFWMGRGHGTASAARSASLNSVSRHSTSIPSVSIRATGGQEIVGALILGFAVTAMHYIAMSSTFCFAHPGSAPHYFDVSIFAGVTTVIASLVLLMAIAAVGFDRRMKVEIAMREQADASVAAEMERFSSVFQAAGAGILMLDREARVVLANQYVLDSLHKTKAEVVGRAYADVRLGGLDAEVIRGWQTATGTERLKPVEFELRSADGDGNKRIHLVTANPTQDEAGRLRYIVLISVDDTERRMGEIRLFDSARLANLGEMATGMAHEINQPLAVIRMATDTLIEELDSPEAKADLAALFDFMKTKLARIAKQTERASTLVDGLRAVARKPVNDPLPFDIAEAARVSGDLLHEQLKAARVDFTLDLPPPGLMVQGEASRLQQVIINLVLNARDALLENAAQAPTGTLGHIRLRVASGPAGGAVLTVEDDGPGIPDHVQLRLFEPFFTTKPTGKGTGLGLSISYDIVKRMSGDITAENRPEGGARFRIVFPPVGVLPEIRDAA